MKNKLPEMMKAVYQDSQGANLIIKEIKVPEPGEGEVLVRMKYAPINPSDLSQLRGTLSPKPSYPFIPGIEGSGIVVAAGKGLIPSMRMAKNVACSPKGKGGTWAEYLLTDSTKCIPLGKSIDMEKGSMLIVNPMSALALMDIAIKGKYSSLVNNAASSSLGLMVGELCKIHNIKLINIIRSDRQRELLEQRGEQYILDSSDTSFVDDYRKLTKELDTRLIFDAVGGEQTGILIKESQKGSRIVLYANLSNDTFISDTRDILQHGKTIEGFSLPLWTAGKSIFQLLRHTSKVKSFISGTFETDIRGSYKFDEVNRALAEYKANMTGGKILLEF